VAAESLILDQRLTVRPVLHILATYPSREEPCREYPKLDDEDIRQALIYAAACVDDSIVKLQAAYETAA
jgi:uncharacterized protein (DUF433 family)